MTQESKNPLRWLFAPAIGDGSRASAVVWTVVRLMVGVMWIYNVGWKVPPGFGGLRGYTADAISHPVFAPYSWLVQHVILPHFTPFAYGVLVVETLLAVALLTGSYVRLAALIGAAQALAIGLSAARAPGEWPWSYFLMVLVHLAILVGAAGRYLAVDAIRAGRSNGGGPARFWGLLSALLGVWAIMAGIGRSATASPGTNLQLTGLEFGLGVYNLLGGVVLVVVGLTMIGWSFTRVRLLAVVGGVIAAAAAVLLRVQIGFSSPLLGGDGSSAAFFFTLVAIAAALAGRKATAADRHRCRSIANRPTSESGGLDAGCRVDGGRRWGSGLR